MTREFLKTSWPDTIRSAGLLLIREMRVVSRVGSPQPARPFFLTRGFDPWTRPVGRHFKDNEASLLYPAVVGGLAVVDMDGCGHAYLDLVVF